MTKKVQILLLCISFGIMQPIRSQDLATVLDSVFVGAKEYIKKDIPEPFSFYYQPFLTIDTIGLKEKLLEDLEFNSFNLESKNLFLILNVDGVGRKVFYGVLWFNGYENAFQYAWDKSLRDYSFSEINSKHLTYLVKLKDEVEVWSEFVTNRSYKYTTIAGAGYVICAHIKVCDEKVEVVYSAFAEYDKDDYVFYLKECERDGYIQRKKMNPNF